MKKTSNKLVCPIIAKGRGGGGGVNVLANMSVKNANFSLGLTQSKIQNLDIKFQVTLATINDKL